MAQWVMKVNKSFSSLQAESGSVIATAAAPLCTGACPLSCPFQLWLLLYSLTQTQAAGRLDWGTCFPRGWCSFWLRMEVFRYKALIPVLGACAWGPLQFGRILGSSFFLSELCKKTPGLKPRWNRSELGCLEPGCMATGAITVTENRFANLSNPRPPLFTHPPQCRQAQGSRTELWNSPCFARPEAEAASPAGTRAWWTRLEAGGNSTWVNFGTASGKE